MTPLDIGAWAAGLAAGSMLLAIPVALAAGMVSFLSPCVVPLLPGYLSYATGLGATEVLGDSRRRGRLVLGTAGFVLGFAVVFVAAGVAAGTLGRALLVHQVLISRIVGALAVVLGLMFAGVIPLGDRELRIRRLPRAGLAAAPLLGLVFGLGWTPCIGPTLAVVLSLAMTEGSAVRGGVLAFVYCLGLGLPFLAAAFAFGRIRPVLALIRRHQQVVLRIGGGAMIVVGLALMTGWWDMLTGVARNWAAGFGTLL